jgi:hypothetical protein
MSFDSMRVAAGFAGLAVRFSCNCVLIDHTI